MGRFRRFFASTVLLRRLAFASVVANVGIVVTGGAVRLTGSGLGCPTWPGCTDGSYLPTPELGVHGVIEFGNRMLTPVVGLVALAGLVAALLHRPLRRALVWPAVLVVLGIPAQAVVGRVTVVTDLNPWVVGCHFLVSMAMIAAAYAFWRATTGDHPAGGFALPGPLRALAWAVTAVVGAVLVVGTFVTGSGPHAGDADARRNGLDPESISQVHADLVFLLLGLSVALWLALRALPTPAPVAPPGPGTAHEPGTARGPQAAAPGRGPLAVAARAAAVLVVVELAQGLVGFVQYLTNLPVLAVGLHMLGACLVWLATLAVLWAARARQPAARPVPPARPAQAPTLIAVSGAEV